MAVMQAAVTSGPCCFCKQPGHFRRNCSEVKRGAQALDRCSACKKGNHFTWQCRSRHDMSGKHSPKNSKGSAQRHRVTKQVVVPQTPKVEFINTLTQKHFTSSPAESQVMTQACYPQGPGALWQPPSQQPF